MGKTSTYANYTCRKCAAVYSGRHSCPKCQNELQRVHRAKLRQTGALNDPTRAVRLARHQNERRRPWLAAGDVTSARLQAIKNACGSSCFYCGIHVKVKIVGKMGSSGFDHVVPRVFGGLHTASNLVVCCHQCNIKKAKRECLYGHDLIAPGGLLS
jgi:5-methylcytosine-specific restriction endonuclease McrA